MVAHRLKPKLADDGGPLSQGALRIGGLVLASPLVGKQVMRAAFLIVLTAVTILALYPRLQLPEPSAMKGFFDKAEHVLAFVALAVLGLGAWQRQWVLFSCLVVYAVILESSQWFSVGRQMSIDDALASLFGLAIGLGLVMAGRCIRAAFRAIT